MYTFRQAALGLMVLSILSNLLVKSAKAETNSVGMTSSNAIVGCVLREPSQSRFLHQIDATKQLYTHRCSGGIYLVDKEISSEGLLDSAVPVVQGWWLDSIVSVHQPDKQSIIIDGRFITGVGPCGVYPFYARILLTRLPKSWQAEEPVLLKSSKCSGVNVFSQANTYQVVTQ